MRKTQLIAVATFLVLASVVSGLIASLAPTVLAQQAENKVNVHFATQYNLTVDGDRFTNEEVTGQVIWRIPNIINITDETGEPVKGLRATLESELAFEWVHNENLVKMGPPLYEWYFGDLVEEHKHTGWATDVLVGFTHQSPVRFTPGLDVMRSFDKTVFTAPDTQTISVTVVPRDEKIESVEIFVHAEENQSVNSVIVSHSGGEHGEQAHVTPDGHYSEVGTPGVGIPVELNAPVTITVTIQVTPKVPEVEYKPHVGLKPNWQIEADVGTSRGSSVSYTNEAGTWTVSAEGNYVWEWGANKVPGYDVTLQKVTNVPPVLTDGKASSPLAFLKVPITFQITYKDIDNDPPSNIRVYIDGSAKEMKYARGAEEGWSDDAVFSCTTALSSGEHTYYFEASDGSLTTRFPEDSTLTIEVTGQHFLVWVIVGVVIIGAGIFFFTRRRRRVA